MSQFYALMSDNTVKHISLKEEIVTEIKNIFINGGAIFKPEGIEEDVFDGNIISRNGENITYVHYDLPEDFARIPYNQADMSEYNITYIIHSGFISGYQNRYGDNLKPPTNVYHRMTA